MPDNTPTEEQKQQVRPIVERWWRIEQRWGIFSIAMFVVFLVSLVIAASRKDREGIFLLFGAGLCFWGGFSVQEYVFKRFVRGLTLEQLAILEKFPVPRHIMEEFPRPRLTAPEKQTSSPEEFTIRYILEARQKSDPYKEYLRPSQQTQDATLLRAATYTDTPQDQLLRASQTEEESPPLTPFPE